MSTILSPQTRLSISDLHTMKQVRPIVTLTAYSAPIAKMLNEHADCIIVGDSLGMVLYGMPDTLAVSLEMMILHGKTVVAHAPRPCVVVDMPFGSYQASKEEAFRNAARVMAETGCQALKLEGGMEMVETVAYLTSRGVPVMAHIGLKPQHLNTMGGYKYQGRDEAARALLLQEAEAFQHAGAFCLLLEGIKESVARDITASCAVPTIGIGASPACDGQVLVIDDLIGMTVKPPRFAEKYADVAPQIQDAIIRYAADVRARTFPDLKHCFGTKS